MPKKGEVLSQEQLQRLAEIRKKAQETKAMKAQLKKVAKEEERSKLKQDYEEKVLKKTTAPVAVEQIEEQVDETDKDIYPTQNAVIESEVSDDEDVVTSKVKRRPKQQPTEPNYKSLYYKAKLERLQAEHQHQQFLQQYSQMPPQQHAVDVAKHQLKSKANKMAYESVYRSLFGL
jgi:hypothetical protein